MNNEERPRITITAERHDELVAAEARLKELHGAGLKALELVGRTMIELARARQAGRRLAEIHKRKHAELETGWGVGAGALREALDIAVDARDAARQENREFKIQIEEAADLLSEGVKVVTKLEAERNEALDLLTKGAELVVKLEAERDAAVEEVNDAKGRELGLTGVLNNLSDKYLLLKQERNNDATASE